MNGFQNKKTTLSYTSFVLVAFLTAHQTASALDLGAMLKDSLKKDKGAQTTESAPNAADKTTSSGTGTSPSSNQINLTNPSKEDEIKLGREIAGNLLGAAPLVKDDGLQRYVNLVGRWVANQSERNDLPWHFGVIESNDVNAFATPGGYVLITKGLYSKLENEAQLAGVLGHEIAHVVKKHHLKVLQKSQLLNLGANLLGNKLGKDNQTVQKVIGNGAEIMARGLDKEAEYEADRMGIVLAIRAGYEPYGLTDVLQTISQTSSSDDSVALLYKTHPSPTDRLTKLAEASEGKLDSITDGKSLPERLYPLKKNN